MEDVQILDGLREAARKTIAEWEASLALARRQLSALDAAAEALRHLKRPMTPWAPNLGDGLVSKGNGNGGTAGMPQSFSMSMSGVAAEGSAGLPAGRQSQPLRDPPFCDICNRPRGPGHSCNPALDAAIDRNSALPKDR